MMDECTGCIFEHSTDITDHMKYCLHCKRCYFAEEARSIHDDLFSAKKGEENMNVKDLQEKLYELYQMRKNGIISEEEYATRIETIKRDLEKERAKQTTYFFRSSINQNEKIKLKPCPFCGYDYATFEHDKEGFVYVQCHKSGCMARTDGCLNEEEAVRLWNRRDYKGGSIG